MFACTRLARQRVCCPRLLWQSTPYAARLPLNRHNSSHASDPPTHNEEDADTSEQLESEIFTDPQPNAVGYQEESRPESYDQFMNTIGKDFRYPSTRKWLGGAVPFPMNPSFLPPAPLSDALRTKIYKEFMRDPKENSVRALSQKYHISLKRVDAILRLKGLESAWTKGKELQTGFQQGMEELLGVEDQEIQNLEQDRDDPARRDVHEADVLELEENRDAVRQRYQRFYWESIPESRGEPIVPGVLELAKQRAQQFADRAESKRAPRIKDTEYMKTPREKVQVVTKTGRPTFEFHDVGSKFIDRKEQLHRTVVAERRARVKREKRERTVQVAISN